MNHASTKVVPYDKLKIKQFTLEKEQELQKEIESKLSGIDDILAKAFKGIGSGDKVQNSAQTIIDEDRAKRDKIDEKKKNLN